MKFSQFLAKIMIKKAAAMIMLLMTIHLAIPPKAA